MLLEGRVAVVTGAGRGIGREFALCLAREGASVVVNDIGVTLRGETTDEDPATEVCKEIEAAGGRAVPAHDSVSDYAAAGRIVNTAVDAFGKIDVLVNNAGIVRDRTLIKMSEEEFDAVYAVHAKGTFACSRAAAAHFREQGGGCIVNITSTSGLCGNVGQTNYAAAKAGILGMTRTWAQELSRYSVRVNALAPTAITEMVKTIPGMENLDPNNVPEDLRNRYL